MKTIKTSYMGKKATLTTYNMDGKPTGLRITALQFDGEENVELRMIDGDGRKDGFKELRSIASLPQVDVTRTVAEWSGK